MTDRPLRLLISGGGTAGHVYPALALLAWWESSGLPAPIVQWVGSAGGMERVIVTERGLGYVGVAAGAVRGKAPAQVLVSAAKLGAGLVQALAAVRRFRPDVVLTTGGYVTVPVAVAARLARVPLVVFLPDVVPGLAVRAQARLATRIALAFPDAARHLPQRRRVVTGYPVRPALLAADRAAARKALGLRDDLPVLLAYGGSQGARTLNYGIAAALPQILAVSQFVHVCGLLDHAELAKRTADLPPDLAARYHLHAFLGDALVDALAAADLCVARAGASTLAELPAAGLPAIVVPGPFSDQRANAEYLARHGAAEVMSNEEVRAGALPGAVLRLLEDPERRARMAAASRALARPDAAATLANLLLTAVP